MLGSCVVIGAWAWGPGGTLHSSCTAMIFGGDSVSGWGPRTSSGIEVTKGKMQLLPFPDLGEVCRSSLRGMLRAPLRQGADTETSV